MSEQDAKLEAKWLLLLRISQRSSGAKRPFAARVLFFNGLGAARSNADRGAAVV